MKSAINGQISDALSPYNRGLAYGDGVFRTMRYDDGVVQDWPLHYQKLVADCQKLSIVCPSADILMQDIKRLLQVESDQVSRASVLKVMITRGEGGRGYAPPSVSTPDRILLHLPLPEYPPEIFSQGVRLYQCQTRLATQPLLAGIKHLNRLENVLARAEPHDPSCFDGLLLDYAGHVIEAVAGNVFIQKNGQVYTPRLDSCGVAGVMRQKVMDWYLTQGHPVIEQSIDLPTLLNADAVIITNSLYGALQVVQLDQYSLPQTHWATQLSAELGYRNIQT